MQTGVNCTCRSTLQKARQQRPSSPSLKTRAASTIQPSQAQPLVSFWLQVHKAKVRAAQVTVVVPPSLSLVPNCVTAFTISQNFQGTQGFSGNAWIDYRGVAAPRTRYGAIAFICDAEQALMLRLVQRILVYHRRVHSHQSNQRHLSRYTS